MNRTVFPFVFIFKEFIEDSYINNSHDCGLIVLWTINFYELSIATGSYPPNLTEPTPLIVPSAK